MDYRKTTLYKFQHFKDETSKRNKESLAKLIHLEGSAFLAVELALLIGGGVESLFAIKRRKEEFEKRIHRSNSP